MKVNWALIGCGDIARRKVVPAIQNGQDSSLISACRADSDKAESFAREFNIPKWSAHWEDSVKDADINNVYVATPVHLHAEQTIAAAEAGKNVLCEKPMALNSADCIKMIDACKANSVKLGIAYYRHFYPAVNRIKELISSGEIGEVVTVQAENFENFNLPPGAPRYWFLRKELSGGGPMMDMGCHRIEVFTNIFGPIASTEAYHNNAAFLREVEDITTAHFTFESGAAAVLISAHAIREPRDTLRIFGSKGSINVPNLNAGTLDIYNGESSRVEKYPNPDNTHQPLIDDFLQALEQDRDPAVDGETGKSINMILDEIYSR